MQNSLPTAKRKTNATEALVGLWTISLAAFVIAALHFTREILIPLALAALLTFLLSPLVTRIERWVGRVAAVLVVAFLVFSFAGAAGWIFTRQLMDLATKLPNYEENIQHKLQALTLPGGGAFSKLSKTFNDLKKDLPGMKPPASEPTVTETSGKPQLVSPETKAPMPVQIVSTTSDKPLEVAKAIIEPVAAPLGTIALIILLVICMLLQREDLRSRLIRLIGQGHISATTHAMDDAGARVSRYLFLQFIVNVCYGTLVASCLSFIGIPNAMLWGAFSTALRFIPYVGAWIAAAFPVILSLAISTSWTMPVQTIGLFVILELICANMVEPWLFGSNTGVSAIAIIMAAVFWTWLWGPVGLLLSTPLTVCVVVMGRHVPRLRFLSVLLSDDEALTPSEECYHRLLAGNLNEMSTLVDAHVKANSLTDLYDNVMIGVVTAAELDYQTESLDEEGRATVEQSVREIIEDLSSRPVPAPVPAPKAEAEPDVNVAATDQPPPAPPPPLAPAWRIYCLPARAERDELAGAMLAHLLHEQGFHTENASAKLTAGELVTAVEGFDADAVCISVIAPSTVVHARYLVTKLHRQFPTLKIAVGLWGAAEGVAEAAPRLKESGANEVVTTLADAVAQLAKLAPLNEGEVIAAPIPEDEEQRMAAVRSLGLAGPHAIQAMDRVTKRVARIFDAPIALVTVIDGEHQHFIGQTGLPEVLADSREASRAESVCGHLVVSNEVVIVDDLARDRRFAGNTFLKANGLRFYAGAPLKAPDGQPVGSLCIMDTKPRTMNERELRLLRLTAEEVMEELSGGKRVEKDVGAVAAAGISG